MRMTKLGGKYWGRLRMICKGVKQWDRLRVTRRGVIVKQIDDE